MSGNPGHPGAGPDDEDLGRLLAEGLGHHTGGPVDERRLLAGARRGAVRIRRRRVAAVTAAAALVVVLPAGVAVAHLAGPDRAASAGSAAAPVSAADAASPEAATALKASDAGSPSAVPDGGPGAERATSATASDASGNTEAKVAAPSLAATAGVRRLASGQVLVPDEALLGTGDLPGVTLGLDADTGNRVVAPVTPARATCGVPLTGLPEAVGSREVTFARPGEGGTEWALTETVRVFAGAAAEKYARAARGLPCVGPVTVVGADVALAGRSRDGQGLVHWYGVVRVGRTVGEVRLAGPAADVPDDVALGRLLRVAKGRLTDSGFAPAAAADPALG